MDAKPIPQLLYTPKALAACEKALRIILKKIGTWGTQLILIGGMTPKYLVGNAPKDIKEHVAPPTSMSLWASPFRRKKSYSDNAVMTN